MKQCLKCTKEFEPSKGLINYCSMKCRQGKEWTVEDKQKKQSSAFSLKEKECRHCKKMFKPKTSKRKFCSKECSGKNELAIESGRKGGLISANSQNRRSKNEIYFFELCKNKFKSVEHNLPIFNNWDADIIINDIKYAILWNGKWHYEKITQKHSLEQVQNRDKIKKKEIETAGYLVYEIKDMGRFNKKFVDEQFKIFLGTFV